MSYLEWSRFEYDCLGLLCGLSDGLGDRLSGMGDDCKTVPLVNDNAWLILFPIASCDPLSMSSTDFFLFDVDVERGKTKKTFINAMSDSMEMGEDEVGMDNKV